MLIALSLALVACRDPYADPGATAPSDARASDVSRVRPTTTPAAAGDTRPTEPAPSTTERRRGAPSLTSFARAYARDAVNWDWRTLAVRLDGLRDRSAGDLSAELTDAIRAARIDESLARDRPASEGTVVAASVQGNGARRRLVVVTRERETASGVERLGPATHRVYLGESRRTADGWRMVEWRRAP